MAAARKIMIQFFRNLPILTRSVVPEGRLPASVTTRYSSFLSSQEVKPIEEYPEVEVLQNAPEWKYVERLLPHKTVPKIVAKQEYPSGWMPPTAAGGSDMKYFVARTKNHMVPVYLHTTFRGQRRITIVRRIQGDIWNLERDLRGVVEKSRDGRKCASRVNEMSGQIHFHGDHVDVLREYLKEQGF